MIHRRAIAVASLVSGMISLYLHLVKIGVAGTLACSDAANGCEYVQLSRYGYVYGVDVALIGAAGYAVIFLVATIGTTERFVDDRRVTLALHALIWPAVAFTAYLKYAEFILLHGFCRWCLISAATIVVCAVLVTLDARRLKTTGNAQYIASFLLRSST